MMEQASAARASPQPIIIVIRGPSGAGKSTVSQLLLTRLKAEGAPDVVYLEQDHFRNVITKGNTDSRSMSTAMLTACVRVAVEANSHAVLEGILNVKHSGAMLEEFSQRFTTHLYYLNISLEETKRRHDTRAKRDVFGPECLDQWFDKAQPTGLPGEVTLDQSMTADQMVDVIVQRFRSASSVM